MTVKRQGTYIIIIRTNIVFYKDCDRIIQTNAVLWTNAIFRGETNVFSFCTISTLSLLKKKCWSVALHAREIENRAGRKNRDVQSNRYVSRIFHIDNANHNIVINPWYTLYNTIEGVHRGVWHNVVSFRKHQKYIVEHIIINLLIYSYDFAMHGNIY